MLHGAGGVAQWWGILLAWKSPRFHAQHLKKKREKKKVFRLRKR
jgi:hypothetical protein